MVCQLPALHLTQPCEKFNARMNVEHIKEYLEVIDHRVVAQAKPVSDRLRVESFEQKSRDLRLPRSQIVEFSDRMRR